MNIPDAAINGGQLIGQIVDKIQESKEAKSHPEHLVGNPLMLFQRFKASYESRDFQEFSDTLSEEFAGERRYGVTKSEFITALRYNLEQLPVGVLPNLTINIHTICPETHEQFLVVLNM
jgi:hypothetical protein